MKLKYYLRGMGIGIIVTTIILTVSFSQREVEISDEQVMVRAAALGMVMAEETSSEDTAQTELQVETENQMSAGTENMSATEDVLPTEVTEIAEIASEMTEAMEATETEDTETAEDTETSEDTETEVTETEDTEKQDVVTRPQGRTYRLIINKGDVCRVVCEKLQSNGVITDAEALRKHLFELGYANSISTGEYDIPYGLTMEEVAQLIVAGPIEKENVEE